MQDQQLPERVRTGHGALESGSPAQSVPLTCSGHTRPVVHLEHSGPQDDGTYLLLSSCKDGNPMCVGASVRRSG